VKYLQMRTRTCPEVRAVFILAVSAAIPVTGFAQTPESLDVTGKLHFHAKRAFSPLAVLGAAAYAGIRQESDSPREWEQGATGYGRRLGSTMAGSGIHSALAFGLDSTLRQDPRYFRSGGTGFWRRSRHALRGTMLTRTDSCGETLSTWRIGSAYGAAFLSNQWYPDRLNTTRLGLIHGSVTLGLDLVSNLASEFWPDIKRRMLRKK
jgi:hypothetical protein